MSSQDISQEEQAVQEGSVHRKRSWIGIIITILVLSFFGYFAYRVVYYMTLINSGDIQAVRDSFSQYQTASNTLASIDIPQGLFEVETEDDPFFGSEDAGVVIVEFADFGCSYSQSSSFVMRAVMQSYQDQVKFIYRDFPMTDLHPVAQKAAEAGECANAQGKFWEYHDKLFQNQSDITEERLLVFAAEVNLDTIAFQQCLEEGLYADEVLEDYQDGIDAGVRGTPTFFLNGNRIAGAIPQSVLILLIENVLDDVSESVE